ncbi:MAG: DUF2800 domain-containing protein [Cyanobacteria bacterium J06638_20]
MGLHAKLSASKTKEWLHCPGQIVVDEMFPQEDTPSPEARLGTAAHALIERCLGEGDMPAVYLGRLIMILNEGEANEGFSILRKGAKFPDDPTKAEMTFEVDEDMVEATTCMVLYVANRCVELGLVKATKSDRVKVRAVSELVAKGTVRLETRTNPFPFRDDTGGTGDVTIDAWPEVLEIVDYKNGSGIFVSVKNNPQVRTYGMGVCQVGQDEYISKPEDVDYELIRMTVVQPRHHEAPDGGVMYEEMSPSDLIQWRDEVLYAGVQRVDAVRMEVEEWIAEYGQPTRTQLLDYLCDHGYLCLNNLEHKCWFCSDNTDYPAAHRKVQQIAAADFADEPVDLDIEEYDMDLLAQSMKWLPFIETWIANMRKAAKKAAMAGASVPAHKLIRKSTHLAYRDQENDEDAIILALTEKFGIDREKVVTAKLATPTQVMALVKKADADEDEKKKFAEDFTYRPQGDVDLVHESKKGTPYVPETAHSDFEGVELDQVGGNTPQDEDAWD